VPDWESTEVKMMVSLDALSSRYHQLPSQAMQHATTFDLYVFDVASRYQHYRKQVADGTYVKPVKELTVEQMKEMLRQVKERNND